MSLRVTWLRKRPLLPRKGCLATAAFRVSPDLLEQGDKFAYLALAGASLAAPLGRATYLGYGCWALPALAVPPDGQWREWIGTLLSEEIERANLVLFAKARSAKPDVLDSEIQDLLTRAEYLLWGLAITAGVPRYRRAVSLAGGWAGVQPQVLMLERPAHLFTTAGMPPAQTC